MRDGARVVAVAALVAGVAAAALLMFGAGGGYRVALTLDNAGQLVAGDHVKVGGVPVGTVEALKLTRDGRARVELRIDDDELAPLHRGSVATVRATSLSGIANRYVALAPGPNNAPEIPDGGEIAAEDGRAAVDLDQVLNSLDPATQASLRQLVRGSAEVFDDPRTAREIGAALEALNPALSQSARTATELARDREALTRLVVSAADASGAVASRPDDLDALVGSALDATRQLADESRSLDAVLAGLPAVLRRTNTTLVDLRPALRELRAAAVEARPSAPLLRELLDRVLTRIGGAALPEVRALRRTIDAPGREDLLGALGGLPPLERAASPALRSLAPVLEDALPVLRDVRPYTPDFVGGLIHGFGGSTGGYYDANGHYTRIGQYGGPASLNDVPALAALGALDGLSGFRTGRLRRCPGAATQPHADGSNPFRDGREDFPCDPAVTPR